MIFAIHSLQLILWLQCSSVSPAEAAAFFAGPVEEQLAPSAAMEDAEELVSGLARKIIAQLVFGGVGH